MSKAKISIDWASSYPGATFAQGVGFITGVDNLMGSPPPGISR